MTLTIEDIEFLTSVSGTQLLTQLQHEDLSSANALALITRLRQWATASQVHAALTMARLREKAVDKFGDMASLMLFTEDALQQASDPQIRSYRAAQFINVAQILDVCCGIGTDAMAFASTGMTVLGLDIDPVRVAIARHNALVSRMDHISFEQRNVRNGIPEGYPAIFFDPARRDEQGRRLFDVDQYLPPLALVKDWSADRIAVKLSPGVDKNQLVDYDAQLEFISVNGDLKEAVLWIDQNRIHPRATLISDEQIYQWIDPPIEQPNISEPRSWLVEPDPALIRAGVVSDVALITGGVQLDDTIAYFTTDDLPESPWLRAWQILDWMPFHLKRLRAYLRERNVGTITVKRRGSPITPEQLVKQLKLKGEESRTLVLTRYNGQPVVIICADYAL